MGWASMASPSSGVSTQHRLARARRLLLSRAATSHEIKQIQVSRPLTDRCGLLVTPVQLLTAVVLCCCDCSGGVAILLAAAPSGHASSATLDGSAADPGPDAPDAPTGAAQAVPSSAAE